ncbi:polysaccharide biosynthesis protein [Liquorilactobacillus mali]|uniref:Polysaccharide biosynthesis protein n=1 Tax=Liquorilactobacillus mali TaxID=1618 RepID=A0A0R2G5T2_9LACO|nr:polysaccharide biosynthesis protein [Liquorilactobacillus mali]KRN32141.1 polysaccharide biosynthesis protein [Liquorilactobacillus mali]MDN7145359.1 polysaccharide biosynthesis protein [Liquorilactobacillus mali]
MNKKLLSGSFWLSFGSVFSRALGVLYLIPWLAMMGSKENINAAQALFNSTYNIYAIFLSLGMAGFPSAIARKVAMYNGKNEFTSSKKIFKLGLGLMCISGLLCALILYVTAPIFAKNSPVVSQRDSVIAIRSMVPAIAILPAMSVIRGWFQGNQDLKPFGISQLWEQVFRVIFILASSYVLIYIFHTGYVIAVYASVFAAFAGALASYIYLIAHYKVKLPEYKAKLKKSKAPMVSDVRKIFMAIAYESIPFVIVGAGINLCQIIDQLFFKQIMQGVLGLSAEYTQQVYTAFSANPSKLTSVITALAAAIAGSSLPLLASVNAGGQKKNVRHYLADNINYLIFIVFPVSTIFSALSFEANGIFFFFSKAGAEFLTYNIWQSLIMAVAVNGLTVLQALHYSKKAMSYLLIGLIIKLILQFPLVFMLQGTGAIMATNIAFAVICILAYRKIRIEFSIDFRDFVPNVLLNVIFLIIVVIAQAVISSIYIPQTKLIALMYSVIFGMCTGLLYYGISKKFGFWNKIFK